MTSRFLLTERLPSKIAALGFCLCAFVTTGSLALQTDSTIRPVEHASVIDTRANEPIRILSMRIPFSISPISGRHQLSFDAHFGNTWNPSGVLEYPKAEEPYPDKAWEAQFHPLYADDPQRYQFYSVDGVIRSGTLTYTRKIRDFSEIYSAINFNVLVDGNSWIDAPVKDKTIEMFHRLLLGQSDPFRRHENGFNRTEMKFTDRDGRTYEVMPNRPFAGTYDIGYRYFKKLVARSSVLWSLNFGLQVGIPLSRARQHLSGGLIGGTSVTKQFNRTYGITCALGLVMQNDKLLAVRREYHDMNYANIVSGYRILLGQNFYFRSGQRFTIGIEMQGATAPLSRRQRVTAPYLTPEDIGVQSSYAPEQWTLDRQINITNQRRAARSLIRGSEFLSLNFSYRFGKSDCPPTVTLYFQEDWTILYDTDGTTLPLFALSNNTQDFGAGIKFSKAF